MDSYTSYIGGTAISSGEWRYIGGTYIGQYSGLEAYIHPQATRNHEYRKCSYCKSIVERYKKCPNCGAPEE